MPKIADFSSLINQAKTLAGKKVLTDDVSVGKVACVALAKNGSLFSGLNVKAAADLGWCAEVSMIAQLLNQGTTEVVAMVTINDTGEIITPCGRCRELLYQINRQNVQTKVIVSAAKSISLKKLLPNPWQEYWGGRA